MATTYPATKQTFTNPTSSNNLSSPSHSEQHANINDTVEAVQDVLGTTAGTSVLKNFAAGHFAARINASQQLIDVNGSAIIHLDDAANAVNYITVGNNGAGGAPFINSAGADSNSKLLFSAKGTSPIEFYGDTFDTEILTLLPESNAINHIQISSQSIGNGPAILSTGDDTNVDLNLSTKGSGAINVNAELNMINGTISGKPQITAHRLGSAVVSGTASTTHDLDLSTATRFLVNMPNAAGSITLTTSNVAENQPFIVEIMQGTAGSGTVNWFSTISWATGTAPTLTATASKKDTFGFMPTGTATFDGFVIGQNI